MNCSQIMDKEKCETVLDTKGLRSCRYNQTSRKSIKCEDLPEEYRLRATRALGLMSGIAKEDEEDKHVTDKPKRELVSTYSSYVDTSLLHNMASLISAARDLKEKEWIFVNNYTITKNEKDRINITHYYTIEYSDINDLSIAELIFFVKKILCGERVMLKWLYRSGNTYHTTYPIDKNILSMVENDYSAGYVRHYIILSYLKRILLEEKKNVSAINYVLNILGNNGDVSSIDQEKIMNYFCNTAKKSSQYLLEFIELSGNIKSTDIIGINLEEEKPVPKLAVRTKQNILGDKLFEKRDIRYYVDYLIKRYDDPNYGPMAAAMIVEAAVVRDIPLSYLERSLFEIKRKIQSIHDELLPTYKRKIQSIHDELLPTYKRKLPLYVEIFYVYQTRNFSETCAAYSELTYNFIADNYLFGGCNCECGVYLLTYIKSLYPDNNWDYYSVYIKEHIFSIVINKKTRQIYNLETTDMTTKEDFIREFKTQQVDEFISLAYSEYSLALGLFSVSTISSRIRETKKFEDIIKIVVCFLYKRYLSKDIIDSFRDVYDIENYLCRETIRKLIDCIISIDNKDVSENILDTLQIYKATIQIVLKYYFYETKNPKNNKDIEELLYQKINRCNDSIDIIAEETRNYFKKNYLN